LCGSRAHGGGVRTRAEQQAEAGDDHGLARAGLAGHGGETGAERQHGVIDDAETADAHLVDHGAPRHPATGSWNLRTSRSVKAVGCRRAGPTGREDPRTTTRAPGGSSGERRPSHQRMPEPSVRSSISMATDASGPTTSGLANRACADSGTTVIASTVGQITGPPAEKLYAVDPVGVETTIPSHPKLDSGRPSISITTSIIRSRLAFSTVASLSAQVSYTTPPSTFFTRMERASRSSTS